MLDGDPFRIVGGNIYSFAFRTEDEQNRLLDLAESFGMNVLRIWAFHDSIGAPRESDVCLQVLRPGASLPEAREGPYGLERLDRAVRLAGARGIRLILTLTNGNADYGGIPLYQRWLGINSATEYFQSAQARDACIEWTRIVTSRYSNEPAVLAWEIANEPRCPGDPSGTELITRWIDSMSRSIRAVAPQQLIASGDEGWFNGLPDRAGWIYDGSLGVSFEAILALPEIDLGTFHFYPDQWWPEQDPVWWGEQWILDHAAAGERAGKPVLLEEYGLPQSLDRNAAYRAWLETIEEKDSAGDLVWMLGLPLQGDRYLLSSAADAPAIRDHARRFARRLATPRSRL